MPTNQRTPWNKGNTKFDLSGLARIALARKLHNNFAAWQKANPIFYAPLKHSPALAELYGTMLGDGCVERYARTEKLTVAFNAKERDHIAHVAKLIENLFRKKPVAKSWKNENCVRVSIYQKFISKRLKFPIGEKKKYRLQIPEWIKQNKTYLIPCLKGLFETDGSWVIDKKYNTNCINYRSIHEDLLKDIQNQLIKLGFYARLTTKRVTLNRRGETAAFANLIKFRQY